jgi:hypothetical protein
LILSIVNVEVITFDKFFWSFTSIFLESTVEVALELNPLSNAIPKVDFLCSPFEKLFYSFNAVIIDTIIKIHLKP